jgi:hypothetical protein
MIWIWICVGFDFGFGFEFEFEFEFGLCLNGFELDLNLVCFFLADFLFAKNCLLLAKEPMDSSARDTMMLKQSLSRWRREEKRREEKRREEREREGER